jgi:hypothetical protein
MLFRYFVIALIASSAALSAAEDASKKKAEKKPHPARQWSVSGWYYHGSGQGALTLGIANLAIQGALAAQANSQRTAEIRRLVGPQGPPPSQTAWKPGELAPLPTYGLFRFKSQPAGAEVFVDGKFVGVTPTVELRQDVGQHAISVRKFGFTNWTRTASLVDGDKMEVYAEMAGETDARNKPRIIGLE